jgi:hypothetical protein
VAAQLHEPAPTFAHVPETVWHLRPELTGSLTETMIAPGYRGAATRHQRRCPPCPRCLPARAPGRRTVEPLVGAVQLERPYCYCPVCHVGRYPRDAGLGLAPGRPQRDVQKAAAKLVREGPDDEAQR